MVGADIIGARLRNLRGEKSREEVSNATGIGVSALANYECGIRVPRDEAKFALANYYNVSVDSIFFNQESHN